MILVDHQIKEEIKKGNLGDNFDDECVQPASYDLRIGPLVHTPLRPEKPADLSLNGGGYRLPPYGLVMLETYETFRMPRTLVGRLGGQSRYSRKGLIAAVGPQVDPGFEGKLFITLQNLTNAAHVLAYKETFLTVEFNRLESSPTNVYSGPYQHRKSLGPEIMADLVRLEGLNLTQMQSQFTELAQHVKEWSNLAARFDEFLRVQQNMYKHSERLEEVVTKLLSDRAAAEPVEQELREVSLEQAKREVLNLFQRHGTENVYYSDMVEELSIDLSTIIDACKELEQQGLIVGGGK